MALSRFHTLLQTRILEEMNKLAGEIADGHIKSYDDYKWHAGYHKGLRDALKLADQVEQEMGE